MIQHMNTKMIYGTACCAIVGASVSVAQSELITFVHTGTGSGTLDGVEFFDAAFSITAIGDTDNRDVFSNAYSITHDSASIFIEGIGHLDLMASTRTFVNNSIGTVGFSRAGSSRTDLFNGPLEEPVFETWDMLSTIGPVTSSNGRLLQWDNSDSEIITDEGHLIFYFEENITTTFAAIVVPAPGGMLVMLGGLMACSRRRRD